MSIFRMKMAFPEMADVTVAMNVMVAPQGTGVTRLAHLPADATGHKTFDDLVKRGREVRQGRIELTARS
jgi:hypothetical protein